jgi:predicted dehydrogenase
MEQVRWGILSTANIGKKRVIPAIHQSSNGVVAAVASRDLSRAQTFAEENNIPRAYGSYDELLADPNIDAVYNPLPNHLHAPLTIAAARAGKAVLCEKPLALDSIEAQTMVDACAEAGVMFAEAAMYRFHPLTARVKQLVDDGAIGAVRVIRGAFTFPIASDSDIRLDRSMGGGALYDVGFYPVSMMRLITGEEPDRASAAALWGPTDVDLTLVAALGFPSGVVGHFDCGFRAVFNTSCEIRGDGGRIVVEKWFVSEPDEQKRIELWREGDHTTIPIPPANHYVLMVEDFADAMLQGRAPKFPPQDAVQTMRVIDRLYHSARTAGR